jgi:hypothetical protein
LTDRVEYTPPAGWWERATPYAFRRGRRTGECQLKRKSMMKIKIKSKKRVSRGRIQSAPLRSETIAIAWERLPGVSQKQRLRL